MTKRYWVIFWTILGALALPLIMSGSAFAESGCHRTTGPAPSTGTSPSTANR